MEDKIFGKMTFRVGWIKYESLTLWEQNYNIRIRTSSNKDEVPSEIQQKSYLSFKNNISEFCSQTFPLIEGYVKENTKEIRSAIGDFSEEKIFSLIIPKEVLFFQNGKFAVLCDTKWSEVGMAILCTNGTYNVDDSYILEFEK